MPIQFVPDDYKPHQIRMLQIPPTTDVRFLGEKDDIKKIFMHFTDPRYAVCLGRGDCKCHHLPLRQFAFAPVLMVQPYKGTSRYLPMVLPIPQSAFDLLNEDLYAFLWSIGRVGNTKYGKMVYEAKAKRSPLEANAFDVLPFIQRVYKLRPEDMRVEERYADDVDRVLPFTGTDPV